MFRLLVAISNSGLSVGPNYYTCAGWPFGSRTFFTGELVIVYDNYSKK